MQIKRVYNWRGNKGNKANGEKCNSSRQGWDLPRGLYSVASVYSKEHSTALLEN
jgi:hypothetical protein